MPIDDQTLKAVADFICGDLEGAPIYRSSWYLTDFFERVGLPQFVHDGSTRRLWVLECLRECSREELAQIFRQLASPKEYGGKREDIKLALSTLNEIFYIEGFEIYLEGLEAKFRKIDIDYNVEPQSLDAKNQPINLPDFSAFSQKNNDLTVLKSRWFEIQACINSEAYLSAIILMGSILEAILLITLQKFPKESNTSPLAPKNKQTQKNKIFAEWKLSEMIDVAHHLGWLKSDRRAHSHALREFRNLIHPREQIKTQIYPDYNTCKISLSVLEASIQDLAEQASSKK